MKKSNLSNAVTQPVSGTIRKVFAPVRRNAPCPCGSGLKFKRCCVNKSKENEKK